MSKVNKYRTASRKTGHKLLNTANSFAHSTNLDVNMNTDLGICVRKSLWTEEYDKCHGQVKRGICNLNLGDLPAIFKSGCLFANKFDLMSSDSRVVKCVHEYLTQ